MPVSGHFKSLGRWLRLSPVRDVTGAVGGNMGLHSCYQATAAHHHGQAMSGRWQDDVSGRYRRRHPLRSSKRGASSGVDLGLISAAPGQIRPVAATPGSEPNKADETDTPLP